MATTKNIKERKKAGPFAHPGAAPKIRNPQPPLHLRRRRLQRKPRCDGVPRRRHQDRQKNSLAKAPFAQGTNNIGEFLAIVHGLAFLKQNSSDRVIYTDSRTAMSWVRKKNCNTKLKETGKNKALFDLIRRAIVWLKNNAYNTPIVKWETKAWGEIPADFGRK